LKKKKFESELFADQSMSSHKLDVLPLIAKEDVLFVFKYPLLSHFITGLYGKVGRTISYLLDSPDTTPKEIEVRSQIILARILDNIRI